MSRIAARMAVVFLLWIFVLATAIDSGVRPHLAEALASFGAGLSLMGWGISLARRRRTSDTSSTTSGDESSRIA